MFNYKEEITKLKKWAHAYYIKDEPLASDEEYDNLYHIIMDYENSNPTEKDVDSPTNRIGSGVSNGFKKAKHKNRMWSQMDIFTVTELDMWLSNFNKNISFQCGTKYDGLSLKLIYDNGILLQAITRGDGEIGEDVTSNAIVINSIPLNIPYKDYLEVSGEIVIHKDIFEKINIEKMNNKEHVFANARNAAAGTMRTLDSNVVAKRKLTFYPWDMFSVSLNYNMDDREQFLIDLGFRGFPISNVVKTKEEILDVYNEMISKRDSLNVGLDGMVIKVNESSLHKDIGYTNKFPKWACAYKFPPVEKTTKILDIIFQVGRTGTITPVAVLEPTFIDGSTVSKVTLHNFSEIAKKDIRINDYVTLIKSGDVIPKLIHVFKDRRVEGSEIFQQPTECPTCHSTLISDGVAIKCVNPMCPSKLEKTIDFFAGRDYLNIDGLGISVIKNLIDCKLIKSPLDLYSLSYEKLELIDNFKDKSITNLLNSLENSKGCPLHKLIAALGIPLVGRTVSKVLVERFGWDVFDVSIGDLLEINGIGDEIAISFNTYILNNRKFIDDMVKVINPIIEKKKEGIYSDMKIVLTGSMSIGKSKVKELVEDEGGVVKSSVSKDTDLVIYGENAGSKLKKAKELKIKTMSYEKMKGIKNDI